jgi:tetratricopeptide (TPR) repeat protein
LDGTDARPVYSAISREGTIEHLDAEMDPGLLNNNTRETILAARELSLRMTLPDLDRAIDLLEKAIKAEPHSGLAHAYLAGALVARVYVGAGADSLVAAEAEGRKAIALSPNSADGHRALAGVLYQRGQFQQALEELFATAELHGTDDKLEGFIGLVLDSLGSAERALPWYDRARKSTKRPSEMLAAIGDAWVKLDADDRALEAYQHAEELELGSPRTRVGLAHLRLLQGDFAAARRQIEKIRETGDGARIAAQIEFFARDFKTAQRLYAELSLREPTGGGSFHGAVDHRVALGRSLQELGLPDDALKTLTRSLQAERGVVEQQANNPEALYRLAAVEASLGSTDSSLQHLRSAVQRGWIDYRSLRMDPRFDSLRDNPEFGKIVSDLSMTVTEKRKTAESLSPSPLTVQPHN